ncbi:MAG TPA: bifunctional UDP-3-O-[3-hydroxymyristoyl] N-acetylglucosamine deacetylase/3-hydroxyacyl-ACP dehydratase [Bacteroidia bacterium]|nr:bifunctional UDP-3-O-[3-hydroxymyristoyl] N-acetylglucosamine deacetylase/3-hydroxyacyl-ACP dehydratase [Bacteroidia bacterium]HNT80420.1 bifunctional UDP-3-O-[3-hydroxymyristoyl] N-acetylglucosamine deacetylase/3-hydroxyacyl-ACP dehydratase [Bacteroidia bacterium]
MSSKQKTIKKEVSVKGVGLHTGVESTLTFKPAPENHGFKFMRIDLENQPVVEALLEYVSDTSRGTTLSKNGVRVSTTEHALAALVGLEIDNVLMEIDGPEIPIMDGSSQPFMDAIQKVGIVEQKEDKHFFVLNENLTFEDKDKQVEMLAVPSDEYRVTVMVDYNSEVLGTQHAQMHQIAEFQNDIAQCRTFCFLHELEQLVEHNLIKGGDLNNAIVVVDKPVSQQKLDELAMLFDKPKVEVKEKGILNNVKLHFQNEPARHKLLDIIGDFALIGVPIKAHILAARPGHKTNVDFARKIKELIVSKQKPEQQKQYDPAAPAIFDISKIESFLPHRYPFLFIDKIIELSDTHVVGVKNVTLNEWYFQGHFPNNPVMPGVLQIEAMAQTGGILALSTVKDPENYWTYFLKIENARFKQKVAPGDVLIFELKLLSPIRRGLCHMSGRAIVDNKVVMEAEMLAQIVKKG